MIFFLDLLYPSLSWQNYTFRSCSLNTWRAGNPPLACYGPCLLIIVTFQSIPFGIYPEILSLNQSLLNTSCSKNSKADSSELLIVYLNLVLDWSVKMGKSASLLAKFMVYVRVLTSWARVKCLLTWEGSPSIILSLRFATVKCTIHKSLPRQAHVHSRPCHAL